MNEDKHEAELPIRTASEAGDLQTAAALTLELYGRGILNFLIARLRESVRGEAAFSIFGADLWHGLPGFAWHCSLRSWAYALARKAANRLASSAESRGEPDPSLSTQGPVLQIIQRARSASQVYPRGEGQDRIRGLREHLLPDDLALLILRIDRGLSWRELAIVMHDAGEHPEIEALEREAASLRKRFKWIKAELRRMAKDQRLIGG